MTGTRIDFVTGAPEKYAHLVDRLSTAPDRLREPMAGSSVAELRREPADGNWSIVRILAHLSVVAPRNGVFIYQMGTMTDPERMPFVEADEAERLKLANPESLLSTIESAVAELVGFLSQTPDAAWGRPGRKNGLRRSLRQEVTTLADHFDEHIAEIGRQLRR